MRGFSAALASSSTDPGAEPSTDTEQGSVAAADAHDTRSDERLNECHARMRALIDQSRHSMAVALRPTQIALDDAQWEALDAAISSCFESIQASVCQTLTDLSMAEATSRRTSAKAQARWLQMKLVHSRRASAVSAQLLTMLLASACTAFPDPPLLWITSLAASSP